MKRTQNISKPDWKEVAKSMARVDAIEDVRSMLAYYEGKERQHDQLELAKQIELAARPFRIKLAEFTKNIIKQINNNPLLLVALLLTGEAFIFKSWPGISKRI